MKGISNAVVSIPSCQSAILANWTSFLPLLRGSIRLKGYMVAAVGRWGLRKGERQIKIFECT
jgi:hypothetical protein